MSTFPGEPDQLGFRGGSSREETRELHHPKTGKRLGRFQTRPSLPVAGANRPNAAGFDAKEGLGRRSLPTVQAPGHPRSTDP